jgi:hypothetical protein
VRHLYDTFQRYEYDRVKKHTQGIGFENMLPVCYQDDEPNKKIFYEIGSLFVESELFREPSRVIRSIEDLYNQLRNLTFDGGLLRIEGVIGAIDCKCFSFI